MWHLIFIPLRKRQVPFNRSFPKSARRALHPAAGSDIRVRGVGAAIDPAECSIMSEDSLITQLLLLENESQHVLPGVIPAPTLLADTTTISGALGSLQWDYQGRFHSIAELVLS